MVVEAQKNRPTNIDTIGVEGTALDQNLWLPKSTSGGHEMLTAQPAKVATDGYYGIPWLKRPSWDWRIAFYFFFEGVSGANYLLATTADAYGRGRFSAMRRTARFISLATLVPCPPLLIWDLGRPERFHHMLRIWKPSSPMNTGAWALMLYSFPVGLLAMKELAGTQILKSKLPFAAKVLRPVSRLIPARWLAALGLPFALTMISYPGVLLATTSNPVWSRSKLLGALISCSSITSGIAALTLAEALRGGGKNPKSQRKTRLTINRLERLERIATAAEAIVLISYLGGSDRTAEPLTTGRYAKHLWLGALGAGLMLPAAIRALAPHQSIPKNSRRRYISNQTSGSQKLSDSVETNHQTNSSNRRSKATIISSLLTISGAITLKWALVYAGHTSADDAEAARYAMRRRK